MVSASYRTQRGEGLPDRFIPGTLIELWAHNTNGELCYLAIGLNRIQPPSSSCLLIGQTIDGDIVNIHLRPTEVYVIVSHRKRQGKTFED